MAGDRFEIDSEARVALRSARKHIALTVLGGLALIVAVVVVAVVDPADLGASADRVNSPAVTAFVTIASISAAVVLLVSGIEVARVRRQRRTLAESPFQQFPARWQPGRVRGQSVPGFVVESADGLWTAVTLAGTIRAGAFETRLRTVGVVDAARVRDRVVVRTTGSTALLSGRVTGIVTKPPEPIVPVLTLHAGAMVPTEAHGVDEMWFRDTTRVPVGTLLRTLVFPAYVVVMIASDAFRHSIGMHRVLVDLAVLIVWSAFPLMVVSTRTVTTVGCSGLTRTPLARRPRHYGFERLVTIERPPLTSPRGAATVVVTTADGKRITISTKRPDAFVDALRRGREFV